MTTIKPRSIKPARKPSQSLTKATTPIADFTYQGGERRLVAEAVEGKLFVRAMTAKGAACAINLDKDGCHKLGAALCRFLHGGQV